MSTATISTSQITNSKSNPAVFIIPATKRSVQNGGQLKQQTNIRVAAYCRVSTGDESQQTSYTKQKEFYASLIRCREGWQFAGIYADEAISGTSRAHRVEFNRMIEDAKAGKIDYIVTKSISRFARNTVDTLNCVRDLRQLNPPVGIYFEKENIDTLDPTGELILTILSALAQDESRSISDNIRWTFQKNFQAGIPHVNLKRMLGYDKGENGEWVINEQQAETVRYIFEHFACGQSANRIARELNNLGRGTVNGNAWRADAVLCILRNEKYVGDLEMQKTITKDFLTHRSSVNKGEAPRYYVEDHHKGIVDRITWNKVQAILNEKPRTSMDQTGTKKRPAVHASPFVNLICGAVLEDGTVCGDTFFRQSYTGAAMGYQDQRCLKATGGDTSVYLEKYSYSYPVWRCKRKLGERSKTESRNEQCPSQRLHECAIEQSFMEMLYALKRDYKARGEHSVVCLLYRSAYEQTSRNVRNNSISVCRLETLREQIKELEEQLINASGEEPFPGASEELRRRLADLQQQRSILQTEQEILQTMEEHFEFFLNCLNELPEVNPAGMKLNVNGLDVQGDRSNDQEDISQAPDFLQFERGIYSAFIINGVVKGDEIAYTTNFGVKLKTTGNLRTLDSFLGFRRANEDGTVELLDQPYKVIGNSIQYRRYLRKR